MLTLTEPAQKQFKVVINSGATNWISLSDDWHHRGGVRCSRVASNLVRSNSPSRSAASNWRCTGRQCRVSA